MVLNTILRLYMARVSANSLFGTLFVFLVKNKWNRTYLSFLSNIHEYCSNKSFSNISIQVTSIAKLDSTYDVVDATEQPDLCYHQCTRCAIIFQCHKIKLYTNSFERCTKPFFYGKCNICNH
jgi:hypothetical protein